jgi:hypothetical protein
MSKNFGWQTVRFGYFNTFSDDHSMDVITLGFFRKSASFADKTTGTTTMAATPTWCRRYKTFLSVIYGFL